MADIHKHVRIMKRVVMGFRGSPETPIDEKGHEPSKLNYKRIL